MMNFGLLPLLIAIVGTTYAAANIKFKEHALDRELCLAHFEANYDLGIYTNLTVTQREFIRDVLVPAVGLRAIYGLGGKIRKCVANQSCMILGDEDFPELSFVWSDSVAIPQILGDGEERVLTIPTNYRWPSDPAESKALILEFLIGHSLHPYVKSQTGQLERTSVGEPPLLLKDSQISAMRAIDYSYDSNEDRLMVVGPTGMGKSEVIFHEISRVIARMKRNNKKIFIVSADTILLVRQLFDSINVLCEKEGCHAIEWSMESSNRTELLSIIRTIKDDDKPLVIVTTVTGFQNEVHSMISGSAEEQARFFSLYEGYLQDEGHHMPAERTSEVVEFVSRNGGRISGYTATPIHALSPVAAMFSGRIFRSYVDDPESFFDSQKKVSEENVKMDPVGPSVAALSNAIKFGELTPVRDLYFLKPHHLGFDKIFTLESSVDFDPPWDFPKSRVFMPGHRYGLKSEVLPVLFEFLSPWLMEHDSGFICVDTIRGSYRVREALKEHFLNKGRDKNVAVINSFMPADEILQIRQDFLKGEINYLIAVDQLNEGVDFPDMSLLLDFSRNISPKTLLQRIGRLLRLKEGKRYVDVISLMGGSVNTVMRHTDLLKHLIEGKLRGDHTIFQESPVYSRLDPNHDELAELLKDLEAQAANRMSMLRRMGPRGIGIAISEHLDYYGTLPTGRSGSSLREAMISAIDRDRDEFLAGVASYSEEALDIYNGYYDRLRDGLAEQIKNHDHIMPVLRQTILKALRADPMTFKSVRNIRQQAALDWFFKKYGKYDSRLKD